MSTEESVIIWFPKYNNFIEMSLIYKSVNALVLAVVLTIHSFAYFWVNIFWVNIFIAFMLWQVWSRFSQRKWLTFILNNNRLKQCLSLDHLLSHLSKQFNLAKLVLWEKSYLYFKFIFLIKTIFSNNYSNLK